MGLSAGGCGCGAKSSIGAKVLSERGNALFLRII